MKNEGKKRYPKYKDSGIPWIGEIPEHWEVKKLKYCLFSKVTDGPHETPVWREQGIPFLSVDNIEDGELKFNNCRKISIEDHVRFKKKCKVERDDILMGKAASIGKIARVKVDFEFSVWSPLAVLKPNKALVEPSFLEYFLKCTYAQENIQILATSNTQQNISMQDIPKIIVVLPSKQEQSIIANYLNRKTAEIDTLIAKKERLLELYEEEKKAIINKAVTKGINPNVKMKDSGISWLGEIPEHWEVKKLKYVAELRSGNNLTSEEIKESGSYPVYGGNGIRGYFDKFSHEGSYVLIGRQGALCGNINYASGRFWATEHAVVVSPKIDYEVKWLGELLRIMNLNIYSIAAAQPGLAVDRIKNLLIPFPSLPEQQQIVSYIEKQISLIDSKIEKTKKVIELLKEYKSSLISEVVTGKRRVV